MSLYFKLLLLSVAVPLVLSFDKRLQFYKKWRFVFPSILLVAAVYIAFDIFLTQKAVWGFNPEYLSGIYIINLPLEEVLFFLAIPYASLHYSFVEYFPKLKLNDDWNKIITISLLIICLIIIISNTDKSYTLYIFFKVLLVLSLSLFDKTRVLQSFYITFLIILIPFILVNGILTGTGIESEVVWYNNQENLGIRFFTIPVEDFGYAFSMIFYNLLIISNLEKYYKRVG